MEGLNQKGRDEYPKFTTEQIATNECEICGSIQSVRKYKIIRRDKTTKEIFLCDSCGKVKPPLGVHLICLEGDKSFIAHKGDGVETTVEGEEKVVLSKKEKKSGDSLLL